MKILCETQIINRNTQVKKMARQRKSTLAVGFHSSSKNSKGENKKELEIIHFTQQNVAGVRYKVRDNIQNLFVKFVQDGRATISFRAPPEDLMIKCDPIQLKAFLQTLKLGIAGKNSINLAGNVCAMNAISQKSHPVHQMHIAHRGDYPAKGFPKTLQQLTIANIQLMKITFEICSLKNLTKLDLNSNKIAKIPNELGRLPLRQFNASSNLLGESNSWQWLNCKNIQKSLCELDLSDNKLTYFPVGLIKCDELVTLKLANNKITRVPFSLRRLHRLRFLTLSSNLLESLPSIFDNKRLDILDVWDNKFGTANENVWNCNAISSTITTSVVIPLWLLAARTAFKFRLPYSPETLPWILCDILSEAPICACGKLCYNSSIIERAATPTFSNVKSLIFSRDRLIYSDIVLCGAKCFGCKQLPTFN